MAIAPADKYVPKVRELGCRFVELPMDAGGTNPVKDLLLLIRFLMVFQNEKPDIYFGLTAKPNIYGSIAARLSGVATVNNIAGLGTVFSQQGWLTCVTEFLYKISLLKSSKVFFQNEEDTQLFINKRLVNRNVVGLLPGSGINLLEFSALPMPQNKEVTFLLISRLLWEKGIEQFVVAAKILKSGGITAKFKILGFLDVNNPSAVPKDKVTEWVADGTIEYLGSTDNVRAEISRADCIVLPSFYGEGTPRVLLEAAASARPIITTDSVGCRNVVDEGVNGYLAIPRSGSDLAKKMEEFAALSARDRALMGFLGRKKAEREFDEQLVIREYQDIVATILKRGS